MAGGIPIRFRRTVSDTPIDPVLIGGALWNMVDKKLGVMNDDGMCWYPGIDPVKRLYVLNQDQKFSGKDKNGDINPIVISYNEPGVIQFLNTATNEVLASVTQNGLTFANPVVSATLPGGSLQRTSHPGFMPQFFSTTPIDTSTPGLIGPNTYLWKKANGSGTATVKQSTAKRGAGAITHPSVEGYVLEFACSSALSNVGLRSWMFDQALAYDGVTNHTKVFVSIWGPPGTGNTIRVGRNGVYISTTVIGNGNWQRIALDIPVHDITQSYPYNAAYEPFAIDWFYNTTGGTWYLSEPTLQNVDVIADEIYQFRTVFERMAIADSYYWAPPTQYFQGKRRRSFSLPTSLPILSNNANYDILFESNGQPITIEDKTARGFTLSTIADIPDTLQWQAKFKIGYRGPLTDIV